MSETSSDTESSCGWTIISHEGSDIETLGSDAATEYGADLSERPLVDNVELQDTQASASAAKNVEERVADSLDDTLVDQAVHETLRVSEGGDTPPGKEHVSLLSSSDHSDIVTLGELRDEEHTEVEEEVKANEEFYLGTSCSSQYAFSAAETIFPAQQQTNSSSSSSEDDTERSTSPVVRRRRLRKNTASLVTEPEEDEEEKEQERQEEEQEQEQEPEVSPAAAFYLRVQNHGGSVLNKCILIALVIAISTSLGHFYGTVQIQERHKIVETTGVNELNDVRDLFHRHVQEQPAKKQVQSRDFGLDNLDKQTVISQLTEVIETMKKENQELSSKQRHIQAQRDDLEVLLKQKTEERMNVESQQQRLTAENRLLKRSLEREEKSLSALQEELRNLRSKIRDWEETAAAADTLLSENQRLKEQMDADKRLMRNVQGQREDMMAEAHTLRKKLDTERTATDELRRELSLLRSRSSDKASGAETEELQSRLTDLEKRLNFEQQRSDLWERLYVETKNDRVKEDSGPKLKKPKQGMAGKVKETFDAVKNSTKEFVHHHKEQIKKAKEAVKENLKNFSDSVKSTFRNFKYSASSILDKARGFYDKKRDERKAKEQWQHRSHRPHHRNTNQFDDFFQSNHNTRKSGQKVPGDEGQNNPKANMKRCSGVFDCAYQESMDLFSKAMEPIRADEFYQLMQSYLQQQVDHFEHWKELEMFINKFFHNGVFIHDRMLFTDFVSGVENYLNNMHEYQDLHAGVFGDLDDYVYRHFFGEAYTKDYGPHGPSERPDAESKDSSRAKHQQRKQQRARSRPQSERKWSRSGRNADRHMADVKIELGPMPFDPKY